MGLGKWLEMVGEKAGDTALKVRGKPTEAPQNKKAFPYSAAGDAARKESVERQVEQAEKGK